MNFFEEIIEAATTANKQFLDLLKHLKVDLDVVVDEHFLPTPASHLAFAGKMDAVSLLGQYQQLQPCPIVLALSISGNYEAIKKILHDLHEKDVYFAAAIGLVTGHQYSLIQRSQD